MKKKLFTLLLSIIVLLFISGCKDVTGSDGGESYEAYTITPEGGTHIFDCGIQIVVPAGAVTEETEIQFRKMETSEILAILEPLGRKAEDILAGFEAKPDGLTFLKDIKVIIRDAGLEPSDFVIVHGLDVDSNKYTLAELSFIYDSADDIIEFSLNHFSGYSAEVLEEMRKTECVNDPGNCRCRDVHSTQSDKNVICNTGDCQKTESKLTTEFRACGTTETHNIYELSEGCKPKITLTAGRTTLSPEENTTITAELTLGCEGLNGQVVDFSVSNLSLGSVNPTNRTTDSDGKAQTTFTAGETEGTVTVTVNATVSYYMSTQEVNGQITNGPMKTEDVSAEIDIEIVEGWNGNFTATFSGCNEVVCVQNYSVEVDFTINELDSVIVDEELGLEISWMGEATVTQSGNVTSNVSECWIDNLYMPATFSEEAFGSGLKDTNEIGLEFLIGILLGNFSFELWGDDGSGGEVLILTGFATGFAEDVDAGGVGVYFKVPFDGNELTESGNCVMGVFGRPPDIWGPYTLTISR